MHVKQGWGEAQVSGVIHNVNVSASTNGDIFNPALGTSCGLAGLAGCNSEENKVGWAVDAGVKVNLPSFGAGDDFILTGAYSQSATWYSGLGGWDVERGRPGQRQRPADELADAFFNPVTNSWSTPTAWSVTGCSSITSRRPSMPILKASIGGLNWSNMGGGCGVALAGCLLAQAAQGPLSPSAFSWIVGADLGWNPVTNLNFDLELMYQSTNQERPAGSSELSIIWVRRRVLRARRLARGTASGFAGRLRITRYF